MFGHVLRYDGAWNCRFHRGAGFQAVIALHEHWISWTKGLPEAYPTEFQTLNQQTASRAGMAAI
jgi:hypothetical protein